MVLYYINYMKCLKCKDIISQQPFYGLHEECYVAWFNLITPLEFSHLNPRASSAINIKIKAVDVYLQKRKTRELVGRLTRDEQGFIFTYETAYLYNNKAISLGPDLPLIRKTFRAPTLFPSFKDRIPSRDNPAYPEYCQMVGIEPTETDPLILVATLGHKGPSSFIFAPVQEDAFTGEALSLFRHHLGLTIREFSELFDFASTTINRIENNKISGKDALKRLKIYRDFPEVALTEIKRNAHKVSEAKSLFAIRQLMKGKA